MSGTLSALNVDQYNKRKIYGIRRGIVEYNVDPLKIGRCKVRVPELHSTEKSIETKDLPWAYPMHHYGGFHDGGSFYVPPVGATVLVQFEMGDPEYPFYGGTFWKIPPDVLELNTKTSKETGKVLPERPISMGQWFEPIGPETPQEILETPYEPTSHIIHKSVKGHTILMEDRDGFERFRIIDRSGQELRFSSPITEGMNDGNASQRGTKSAFSGDTPPYKDYAGGATTIELLGTSGQGIKILSKENSEYIEIVSKDDSAKATPDVAKNKISLLIGGGLGILEIAGVKDSVEKVKLVMDLHSGSIELKSTSSITLKTDILTLVSSLLQIRGDVSIEGDLTVRGDSILSGDVIGINEAKP